MTEKRELRYTPHTEMRARRGENDAPIIEGYAAVFGELSEVLFGMFREEIAPGAFTAAITKDDVRGLFNHDNNFVLGRNVSGTLRLYEDSKGLGFELHPDPRSQTIRDLVLIPLERGDISQCSFQFTVNREFWVEPGKDPRTDLPVRRVEDANLFDISIVTYPAYPQTTADVRSYAQRYQRQKQALTGDQAEATVQAHLRAQRLKLISNT